MASVKVDKIDVRGDSRIQYRTAQVNGRSYGYLFGHPESGQYKATIFLIHGFPDLSMGWRYQIPLLIQLGFRVVVPDCLGYGRTDAPDEYESYSHKRCADDIKELATQLGELRIVVCGHDWGAALTYRIALWHPDLVSHVITICVPYMPPSRTYIPLEELVKTRMPNFAYQLQFKSGELEKAISTRDEIRQFLIALYGGRTDDGRAGFNVSQGVLLENLKELKPSRLLSMEEIDYYADEFARHGIHGPLNWYRTREINHTDELALVDNPTIPVPLLFIQALRDAALPPHLGQGMAAFIPQLTVEQVNTSHWALWEDPRGVNEILARWLGQFFPVEGGEESKL
ncbi:hypothetical protein VTN77DRAFT_5207 [Rasamsonia byssochlamydoides]|uniref:uncharacterized protein n=1 Tax=Rasamsonia byssochlamydoides TaxID=89139 RepID=UPI0037420794